MRQTAIPILFTETSVAAGQPQGNIHLNLIHCSGRFFKQFQGGAYLPPHPGPLPKERENRLPMSGESNALGRARAWALNRGAHGVSESEVGLKKDAGYLFPLPAGEGKGEGERDAANQNGRKFNH